MEKLPTPKEKAKELFNTFCYAIRTEETDSGYFTNVIYAKQCALIAVNEILKEYSVLQIETSFCYKYWKYWNEVKHEIEAL